MHVPPVLPGQLDALEPDAPEPIAVSHGMGLNSTAMLVGMHRLGIRPDLIITADTGGEWPETWTYHDRVIRPWLSEVGFPDVTLVRYEPRHVRYTTLEGSCLANQVLPSIAYGRAGCSRKFKIEPMERWQRRWEPAIRAWRRGQRVVKLIGYDAGPRDARRGHDLPDDPRYRYRYPLRDEWRWDRERCREEVLREDRLVRLARAAGIGPVPRKSACFFCSSAQTWEIRELDDLHPDLADRIMAIEAAARPRLRVIDGLWRRPRKGARGTEPRPGDMTSFILPYRAQKAAHAAGGTALPVLPGTASGCSGCL